jgi:hypothetical protein
MSHDVLVALDSILAQLRKQLMNNPEYRAMLSVERTMSEIADIIQHGGSVAGMDRRHDPRDMVPEPPRRQNQNAHHHGDRTGSEASGPVSSVLEAIAARAVDSVASRSKPLPPFVNTSRMAQGGR